MDWSYFRTSMQDKLHILISETHCGDVIFKNQLSNSIHSLRPIDIYHPLSLHVEHYYYMFAANKQIFYAK